MIEVTLKEVIWGSGILHHLFIYDTDKRTHLISREGSRRNNSDFPLDFGPAKRTIAKFLWTLKAAAQMTTRHKNHFTLEKKRNLAKLWFMIIKFKLFWYHLIITWSLRQTTHSVIGWGGADGSSVLGEGALGS